MLRHTIVPSLAFAAALFHLYAAGVAPLTAFVQRPVHLALMATLGFLGTGVRRWKRRLREQSDSTLATSSVRRWVRHTIAAFLISAALLSCVYMVVVHEDLVRRAGAATTLDLVAGALLIVITLELARRTAGWGLVTVALIAVLYAFVGPHLPGLLAHRGYSPRRLIEHLYLTTEGIWGVPLGVSANFVYLFVLFGAVLDAAGGGKLLIGLSARIAGSTRGGAAKTAAVASALMGSLSGSAVANDVTTGSLTIPVMKRTGFRPSFAAAIEAAASTGGQLMPPIMGAGAFILATWTNIPYIQVAIAAAIPAGLYYVALFAAIHFQAHKMKLAPGTPATAAEVLRRLHLLLPLGVIVLLLVLGRSPMRAAFWGVVSASAMTVMSGTTRLDWKQMRDTVVAAAAGTVQVAAACAAAGIVVGVASLTGIGLRTSEFIIALSGGHLPVALVLTALGSIVLGMGLPTTAAYVVLAALGAPALTELGVPLLAAHLFIFYFGCLSNVTPPVALAAYAAAGIAGAPPLHTAATALTLASAGFLIPFMFIYGPPLLLVGSPIVVLGTAATAAVGVTALAAATVGFMRRRLAAWERTLLLAAALSLLWPGIVTDVAGVAIVAFSFLRQWRRRADNG
ncbi:MAG: TRAP transporter fused permease subunit [Gemmatimonadales bacterium]